MHKGIPPPSENSKTILWADDDADDLMLMRQILSESGINHHIIEVPNGLEAIHMLKKAAEENKLPCLIILDMNMPVMNGRETLTLIKEDQMFAKIPVVVFTTSNSKLDQMFCDRYQVEMITKPPKYENLNASVKKLLTLCV